MTSPVFPETAALLAGFATVDQNTAPAPGRMTRCAAAAPTQPDCCSLALPLLAETRHLLGTEALARMRPGCRVVNVGRDSVVDEAAVAPGLLDSGRTVFTPHLGSAVVRVRGAIEMATARNIIEALAGRIPPDAVNQPVRST